MPLFLLVFADNEYTQEPDLAQAAFCLKMWLNLVLIVDFSFQTMYNV